MSLANKYRPKKLKDVCGHESEVKRIEGILKSGKIPNSLAFLGMTGTGKTTLARIFAAYVNCTEQNFCGKCESCKLFLSKDGHPDVNEINAANTRTIEDARNLLESLRYKPSVGKYRIVILDEVQQLTPQAQQAILKALEEPPTHVIFILCSMEPEKLDNALLTRCSRFYLENPSASDIAKRLYKISKKEGIEISKSSIKAIAQNSGGCVRLAVESLESAFQLIESCETQKEAESLIKKHVLKSGTSTDDEIAIGVLVACQQGNPKRLHKLLLDVSDFNSLTNKMTYLVMYQLDSGTVNSHKNVWHTSQNLNYVKQLSEEKIEPYNLKVYEILEALNNIKVQLGTFLANPRAIVTSEIVKVSKIFIGKN